MSRRAADKMIADGKVSVNGEKTTAGAQVTDSDNVTLNNKLVIPPTKPVTIMINKPVGYVCSRNGQGSKTIYDLLPGELHSLKPVGRLDKDSSGLLLLTNDGQLANQLTHPRYQKTKVYLIELDKDLAKTDLETITQKGVELVDGHSKFGLNHINHSDKEWKVTMTEGRNRQIRRTFEALGYNVTKLNRIVFGDYRLEEKLAPGSYIVV